MPPAARAANEKVTATTRMNTSSPSVRSSDDDTPPGAPRCRESPSAKPRHVGDDEKLSNAVDPSNTASSTTTPGRTGSDGRWSNGLPTTIFSVSGLRQNGQSRDTAMLYTPNGSARAS